MRVDFLASRGRPPKQAGECRSLTWQFLNSPQRTLNFNNRVARLPFALYDRHFVSLLFSPHLLPSPHAHSPPPLPPSFMRHPLTCLPSLSVIDLRIEKPHRHAIHLQRYREWKKEKEKLENSPKIRLKNGIVRGTRGWKSFDGIITPAGSYVFTCTLRTPPRKTLYSAKWIYEAIWYIFHIWV